MTDGSIEPPIDFEGAAQAKLGLWAYDRVRARFVGSRVADQIFELDASARVELDVIARIYGPASFERLTRAIESALADGTPFTIVSEIHTASGQRKWVRTQGHAADDPGSASRQVLGTVQDISDIRLLDRVTMESEMTLNQVEQITHIGHWSVSLADGSFFHSDEIKRIFGYEPSEYALGIEEAIQAYHPDDRDEVIRLFNHAVETGESYEFDLRVVQPSGDVRHAHSKGYTERDEHGKVTRVYGVFQDITDRVRAQAEKAQLEAALHQSQRLEAIGRLAGGVAHDFNNLLTAIFGYVDLALASLDHVDSGTFVRESLDEIARSSQRAAALVRQLLAFSRQQVTLPDVLDLNATLTGAHSMLRRVVTEDIELSMMHGTIDEDSFARCPPEPAQPSVNSSQFPALVGIEPIVVCDQFNH